ncbi:MAG TPA: dihydrofolate reductase family protein [Candidatus Acidoferrum sp.]|nr:dihydrofolate reductase family protein [Candidatus Acidoferrum sp.]
MRKLIFAINTTLDGCVDHTKVGADEETHAYWTGALREAGLQVFGRKTYQLMVPYWPDVLKDASATKSDIEFAHAFVSTSKVVFSRSLDSVEDRKTRIVRADLRDEILRLKQEPGKHILLGGVDVASQLIQLGLVDEYRFVVGPALVGEGRRLLDHVNLPGKLQLKLIDSKFFKSGSVALHYAKA